MRIGIDARYLSHGLVGGVHTHVKHLIPALIDVASEHQVFLYADTKRPFELAQLPAHVTLRRLPWRSPLSSAYHDVFMRHQMTRDRLDIVHFPTNYGRGPRGVPMVVTLHDALNILPLREILWNQILRGNIRQLRTVVMTLYLHAWSTFSIARAALVVTCSEHARDQIARHSKLDASRIVPILQAASPDLRRVEDPVAQADVRRRLDLPEGFVLADALKNPAVVVRAWRLLPTELRHNRQIVFFSRRPEVLPIVHEAVSAGEARLLLRPSREDLIALYGMTEMFLFPSWIEGFGLPILEAMTCGAPVVASDRGSIPEVAGDAALLADAEDERAFAAHIRTILEQPGLRQELRNRGFAQAARFSWTKTARETLAAYVAAVVIGRGATGLPVQPPGSPVAGGMTT